MGNGGADLRSASAAGSQAPKGMQRVAQAISHLCICTFWREETQLEA